MNLPTLTGEMTLTTQASSPFSNRTGYGLALLIGLYLGFSTFPLAAFLGQFTSPGPSSTDTAQHIVGQWYYFAEPWSWPPLVAHRLADTSIGLTDSIPLTALFAKLFRPWLPPGFQTITIWLAMCWILQPVAAVFALRSLGEKRLIPAIAAAVMAASMPTFIFRAGHEALCGHFLILVMIGLYFRLCAHPERRLFTAAAILMAMTILIHAYLMMMVASLFLAVPVTLWLRGDRHWRVAAAFFMGGLAAAGVLFFAGGFWGAQSDGGYGVFSMNLLAPFYPADSSLLPNKGIAAIDRTGGQYEGFQYLGAGLLLLLLLLCISLRPGGIRIFVRGGWRRHGGLLAACLCLTLLALSHKWYLGQWRVLVLFPNVPDFLQQIRSSGRLFWPVAYLLLIISIATIARQPGKQRQSAGFGLLALAAALQFLDTAQLRADIRDKAFRQYSQQVDGRLQAILANQRVLNIYMPSRCWNSDVSDLMQVLWIAARSSIAVNTMYTARSAGPGGCALSAAGGPDFAPGEIKLFLPQHQAAALLVDDAATHCRALSAYGICAADPARVSALPAISLPHAALGDWLSAGKGQILSGLLAQGWLEPEPWGTWNWGGTADLILPDTNSGALQMVAELQGFAPVTGGIQQVAVLQNGIQVAAWAVPDAAATTFEANLPAISGPRRITFKIARPTSPAERHLWRSDIPLGIGLKAIQLSAAPAP